MLSLSTTSTHSRQIIFHVEPGKNDNEQEKKAHICPQVSCCVFEITKQ